MTWTDVGLYIHIPWCRARCGYCDFNTYVLPEDGRSDVVDPYLRAVCEELEMASRRLGESRVATVYVGGGTPTMMSGEEYAVIMDAVTRNFQVVTDAEITTEANPETLTPRLLEQIRGIGVNRLSLGMQSAVGHVLASLDRAHTPGRVAQAVAWARSAGFDNLSLDLIYGTPGESLAEWETTLDAALALAPEHVSAYSLIVEDGTPLSRRMAAGELPCPDDDDLADKYLMADATLAAAGLGWYEVSNWALPGRECRHNMAYWRSTPWWGIGAGAHSFHDGVRWWNHRRPATYIAHVAQGSPVEGSERLSADQARVEAVMLGLRLAEGMDESLLTDTERARAQAYVDSGRLVRHDGRLMCSLEGRLIADGIVREILD
ncbi:MAG: radical SAM family heme chaperone HemW [Propionibacteriaceae bacterium]|nr:radical SAM family heme chaperone HemW [Propionibacteriaceae bacterium]